MSPPLPCTSPPPHRDVEGNDDFDSPYNAFTPQCIHLIGRLSQLAKQAGYLVAMAPAESYLDPTTHLFDLTLTHTYPEWDSFQPGFRYHGHNTYAYLLARYGATTLPLSSPLTELSVQGLGECSKGPQEVSGAGTTTTGDVGTGAKSKTVAGALAGAETETATVTETVAAPVAEVVATFDFVTVQLYEGYSHAQYQTYVLGRPASQVVAEWVKVRFNHTTDEPHCVAKQMGTISGSLALAFA